MMTIPCVVEVRFVVHGIKGVTTEKYELGRAMDMVVWQLNNVATAAMQLSVSPVVTKDVSPGLARHMVRSRAGMRPFIQRTVKEMRRRMAEKNAA
jgi:hypothetical protein